MACSDWKDEWVAELYGELDAAERERFEAHLEACADCRATLEGLEAARGALREAAPEVPATPRVVVLRPRPAWSPVWTFAAGAAAALVLFGAGFVAGPRWSGERRDVAEREPGTETSRAVLPARDEAADGMRQEIDALRDRLARLESRPAERDAGGAMTDAEFKQALDRLEKRWRRERAEDLEYVTRSLTASEVRTGLWMDQTNEMLTMVAMRQDPQFTER